MPVRKKARKTRPRRAPAPKKGRGPSGKGKESKVAKLKRLFRKLARRK